MKLIEKLLFPVLVAGLMALPACGQNGGGVDEEAEADTLVLEGDDDIDDVDDALEETGEAIGEGVEDVGEAVDEAAEEVTP